jgi:hypothetical protein
MKGVGWYRSKGLSIVVVVEIGRRDASGTASASTRISSARDSTAGGNSGAVPEARQVDVNQNLEGRKGQELVDEPQERWSLMANWARFMVKYMYAEQNL